VRDNPGLLPVRAMNGQRGEIIRLEKPIMDQTYVDRHGTKKVIVDLGRRKPKKPKAKEPQDWMITTAYTIAEMLPTDHREATEVLHIVCDMVEKINKPHMARLQRRQPRKAAGK
jgi:hypothetical protein